jgi:hypothetical protein
VSTASPGALELADEAAAPRSEPDLGLSGLALVADQALAMPLALRGPDARRPLVPSPLVPRALVDGARAAVARLVAGWSLYRQHAPWALALGPLASLERVPRLVLDGFVVAPASWRVPASANGAALSAAALRSWRRRARVPRWVHVGDEDRLLPVDLGRGRRRARRPGRA